MHLLSVFTLWALAPLEPVSYIFSCPRGKANISQSLLSLLCCVSLHRHSSSSYMCSAHTKDTKSHHRHVHKHLHFHSVRVIGTRD